MPNDEALPSTGEQRRGRGSGGVRPPHRRRSSANNPAIVALVVKEYAEAAGLDPAEFSGHSLRAGFVTSAAESGASILKIQETSRHKSTDVLAGYVRRVDLFKDHAGAAFL